MTKAATASSTREMFEAGDLDQAAAIRWLLLDRQTVTEATNLWGRPSGWMVADLAVIDRDLAAVAGFPVNADAMMTAAVRRQDYSIVATTPTTPATQPPGLAAPLSARGPNTKETKP